MLDLVGVISRLDRYRLPVGGSGVVRVRAAQFERDPIPIARVVFDLEGPRDYSVDRRGSDIVVSFVDTIERTAKVPAAIEPAGDGEIVDLVQELEARFEEMPLVIAEPSRTPNTSQTLLASDPPPATPTATERVVSRAVEPDLIDRLVRQPKLAGPAPPEGASRMPASFATKRFSAKAIDYSGQEISLNLVDADIKQIFRLFHVRGQPVLANDEEHLMVRLAENNAVLFVEIRGQLGQLRQRLPGHDHT